MANFTAWNGRPDDPERTAWHWVEDADGLRPLLWRGDDWAESMDRDEWQDGFTCAQRARPKTSAIPWSGYNASSNCGVDTSSSSWRCDVSN